MKKHYAILLLLLASINTALAQTKTPDDPVIEKINTALGNYFLLDRENIHAHFDKNVFATNEQIWFKGYVLNRKTDGPSYATTNIFAVLLDANGNKLSQKLLFATNGNFTGNFKLDKGYASGFYYIQFFTTWMNNFNEDESAVYRLEILNEDQPMRPSRTDTSVVNIDFHPEGGNFIYGISNSVGVKVSDCFGEPTGAGAMKITDEKGETVTTVYLNRYGYGRFEITPVSQRYKAVVHIGGIPKEALLPAPSINGFHLQVNNFALEGKTVVKISAAKSFAAQVKDKKYLVAINKDEKSSFFYVDFSNGKTEQTLSFANDYLFEGVNTIRLLDQDLSELASRIVFKFPVNLPHLTLKPVSKGNANWEFSGETTLRDASLSIAVLPGHTIALNPDNDIYASLLLDPYLAQPIKEASYYFSNQNTTRKLELDLVMLQQKEHKYHWKDLIDNPPVKRYEPDFGLTLKGTVSKPLKDPKSYRVRLFSMAASLDETAVLNQNNEFHFQNLALSDSTSVNLTLHHMADVNTILNSRITAAVVNGNTVYHKVFKPSPEACVLKYEKIGFSLPMPDKNAIALDTVAVSKAKPGKGLTYENKSGNWALRGYKIEPSMHNTPLRVFLEQNGFNVSYDRTGQMTITGRRSSSLNANGVTTPIIYMDDIQQFSLMQLEYLRMDQLEEIYINTHYAFPGINRHEGIIKFYTKKGANYKASDYKGNATVLKILNGFEKKHPFKNETYIASQGFENLGIVSWDADVKTDANGKFRLKIPATGTQNFKIKIEGLSPEGQLISKTLTPINEPEN